MSLPAVVQHLQVLETSGLVRSEKVGRVRTCRLEPAALQPVEQWVSARRSTWERRLDRLGDYLADGVSDRSTSTPRSAWSASTTPPPSGRSPPGPTAAAKARWYSDPEQELELDFRVGGWERHGGTAAGRPRVRLPGGLPRHRPGRRIVYTYEMRLDGIRISVSLATAEFKPEGDGTRLVFTEQGAFFDGHEAPAQREHGMGSLLDLLGKWLAKPR